MAEYTFALQWTISEDHLRALRDSTPNESLKTDKFAVVHALGIQYGLYIYPNGDKEERQGKTWIFLYVNIGNAKKIEAECTFSIKSANWSHKMNKTYEKSDGFGNTCCTVNDLFELNKKFIVDEKLTVKVEGILKLNEEMDHWHCFIGTVLVFAPPLFFHFDFSFSLKNLHASSLFFLSLSIRKKEMSN